VRPPPRSWSSGPGTILAVAGLAVTLTANWRRLHSAARFLLPVLLAAALPARRHPDLAAVAGEFLKLGAGEDGGPARWSWGRRQALDRHRFEDVVNSASG
jgi:hypothetical protein